MTDNLARPETVERIFAQVLVDVGLEVELERVDELRAGAGFLVRARDRHGRLPDTPIFDPAGRESWRDAVERAAAKLSAIVRLRGEIMERHEGARFLEAPFGAPIAGLVIEGTLELATAETALEAWQGLARRVAFKTARQSV